MSDTFAIQKTVRSPMPRVPFERMKEHVLGKTFSVSLVIVGDSLMHRLNKTHRKKDYATNVLAFPIGKNEGEIFINVRKAEREAKSIGVPTKPYIAYLFIHALLHLDGHQHGSTMESKERQVLRAFGFDIPVH